MSSKRRIAQLEKSLDVWQRRALKAEAALEAASLLSRPVPPPQKHAFYCKSIKSGSEYGPCNCTGGTT